MILAKNTIRDGGSTTLLTAYTVDTVNTVYTAKTLACMPIYIILRAIWKRVMSCPAKNGSECMDGLL